jgi:hypothetical protein
LLFLFKYGDVFVLPRSNQNGFAILFSATHPAGTPRNAPLY